VFLYKSRFAKMCLLPVAEEEEADVAFKEWCQEESPHGSEPMDSLGELEAFPKPYFDKKIHLVFMIDDSGSTNKRGVVGAKGCTRLEAAFAAVKHFIVQQQNAGAKHDTYTLGTFSESVKSIFSDELGQTALDKISEKDRLFKTAVPTTHTQGKGYVDIGQVFSAIEDIAVPGEMTRVVILSQGQMCMKEKSAEVVQLQTMVANNPCLDIHTIGFGCRKSLVLQQFAQIGRGSFTNAATDMTTLVSTFTTMSTTITQTRARDRTGEKLMRSTFFENARIIEALLDGKTKFKQKTYKATRYTHDLSYDGQPGNTETNNTSYQTREKPFMQGGRRLSYYFTDLERPWLPMVMKKSKFEADDCSWDFVNTYLRNTAQARLYANSFQEAVSAAHTQSQGPREEHRLLVSVNPVWSYEDRASDSLFVAEPFLTGSKHGFSKWINNRGEILIPQSSCHYAVAVETFVHFILEYSQGEHMLVDVQGVLGTGNGSFSGVQLTNPQILSKDASFGPADLEGAVAMQRFASRHVCGPLCRKLHLPLLRSTIPRTPRAHTPIFNDIFSPPKSLSALHCYAERVRHAIPDHRAKEVETVTVEQLFLRDDGRQRGLLFLGDRQVFSTAAAKLCAERSPVTTGEVQSDGSGLSSTEDCWPQLQPMMDDLSRCRQRGAQNLEGAVWVVACPHNAMESPRSSTATSQRMHELARGFVTGVAEYLDLSCSRVSFVFLPKMQHLAWALPLEIETPSGCFLREVFRLQTAPDHVVAQWSLKISGADKPGGMTDHSESAQ